MITISRDDALLLLEAYNNKIEQTQIRIKQVTATLTDPKLKGCRMRRNFLIRKRIEVNQLIRKKLSLIKKINTPVIPL